ncbi:MAG: hypothetical protein ACKVI1_05880 [Flavobacteriales bacterium]
MQVECQTELRKKKMLKPYKLLQNNDGTSQKLSANLLRMRMKMLKSVQDETLDDALSLLRSRHGTENDVNMRLASMAAQTWIIRQKFLGIGLNQPTSVKEYITELAPKKDKLAAMRVKPSDDVAEATDDAVTISGWQKVKILKETEVNGMQFFENTTINVSKDDADKLITAKKAMLADDGTPDDASEKSTPKKAKTSKAKS